MFLPFQDGQWQARQGAMGNPHLADWYAGADSFKHCGQKLSFCDNRRDAEAVFLLHGFPNSSWDWHKLWPLLGQHYRLVAPDFLGYGHSDKPQDYDYSLVDQADQVIHLMSHLGITRAHFMGHSSGITVIQELLALVETDHDPDLPGIASACFLNGSIVPGNAPSIMEQRLIKEQGDDVTSFLDVDFLQHVMDNLAGPDMPLEEGEAAIHWQLLAAGEGLHIADRLLHFMDERKLHHERWIRAMCATEIPMLGIVGAADPVWGEVLRDQIAEELPFLDISYVAGAGHYVYLQAPEQVSASWQKFHSRIAAGSMSAA